MVCNLPLRHATRRLKRILIIYKSELALNSVFGFLIILT